MGSSLRFWGGCFSLHHPSVLPSSAFLPWFFHRHSFWITPLHISLIPLPPYHSSVTAAPGAFHVLTASILSLFPHLHHLPPPLPRRAPRRGPQTFFSAAVCGLPVNVPIAGGTAAILTALQTRVLCSGSLISFMLF